MMLSGARPKKERGMRDGRFTVCNSVPTGVIREEADGEKQPDGEPHGAVRGN